MYSSDNVARPGTHGASFLVTVAGFTVPQSRRQSQEIHTPAGLMRTVPGGAKSGRVGGSERLYKGVGSGFAIYVCMFEQWLIFVYMCWRMDGFCMYVLENGWSMHACVKIGWLELCAEEWLCGICYRLPYTSTGYEWMNHFERRETHSMFKVRCQLWRQRETCA